MEKSDDRLKELMKTLAETISQVFSGNDEIKQALSLIEKEGYHVDLILATVTRISRKGEGQQPDTGINDFDRSFLRKVRIKFVENDVGS